jgi:hypothetical protein
MSAAIERCPYLIEGFRPELDEDVQQRWGEGLVWLWNPLSDPVVQVVIPQLVSTPQRHASGRLDPETPRRGSFHACACEQG